MKATLYLLFLLCISTLVAQDWANLEQYKQANEMIVSQDENIEIVFFGDSITESWPNFNAAFFNDNAFVGRGISGQTTPQMLLRFRQDVISLQPKKVVLLAGINDIAQNTGPIALEAIMDNIISMAELAKSNGIEMLLCSVLPANFFPWRPEIVPTQKVIKLNELFRSYANDNNLIYVDYYTAMVDQKQGLNSELGYDTVHPNKAGYAVMEQILMNALNGRQ